MTVYIADISECNIFDCEGLLKNYEEGLPQTVTERVNAKKSPKARLESSVAYLLVREALSAAVGEKNAREQLFSGLYFTDEGRPSFKNDDFDLSVSHSDGICVAAVADNRMRIGIDVEEVNERNVKTAESVLSRLINFSIPNGYTDDIRALKFTKNGVSPSGIFCGKPDGYDEKVMVGWTALESALKCHGGGFSALKEATEVFRKIRQTSFTVRKNGKVFVVTLTEKKRGIFAP